jgi:hypothetical protein
MAHGARQLVRRLGADRLGLADRHDPPLLPAVGQLPDMTAHLAEVIHKELLGNPCQLADRLDAQSVQALFSLLPHTPDATDR